MAIKQKEVYENENKKKFRFTMPDAYVIIFSILLIAAIATLILPSGEYSRETVDGVTRVVPDSYQTTESEPLGFMDIPLSIQNGMVETAELIFLVLIIGGAFAVIESTGTINALIKSSIAKTKNKEYLLIAVVCIVFSVFGALGILTNAQIAFIPIGIILARSLGLDAIIGVALIKLGADAGHSVASLDPISTGLAQNIAELPLFSGVTLRLVLTLFILAATILYICYYTKKVKDNPEKSYMGKERFPTYDSSVSENEEVQFTGTHKLVLTLLALCMGFYIFGVFNYDWTTSHMAAIFIVVAIGTAVIARLTPNKLVKVFTKGTQQLAYGALIIGLARSIIILLENQQVLDTIVHGLSAAISPLSSYTGAIAMFVMNALFNLFVSSGSAQAAIVMPLMTPLADIMEIPRQVAVLAYKLGDGFTNVITPASGTLMACLAVAGVSWIKWIKFILPLVAIWTVLAIIFLSIAVVINWGPF
ncbi:YfcC family protein [Virgibacillus sp. NKC19-3]|uniref:YfcC family protein n=1 Tax=Virgibacillus saliphilus TaxID=2831674 RepID=UPI001C9B2BF6|nr:AbgT family transporter [Virgibacillus sp. NKC19-3]MBY7144202.1 YfcC family protein [Virgibacillus sp. NKC19-3]